MKPHCPHCHIPLTSSVVGLACDNCGRLYRYADDPLPQQDNLESSWEQTSPSPVPPPTPSSVPKPQSETSRPSIINHRASSHYRRRLQERQHQLERPALNDHYEDNPGSQPTHQYRPEASTLSTSQVIHGAPVRSEASTTGDYTDTEPLSTITAEPASKRPTPSDESHQDESDQEIYGPHKPSPHILDVTSAAPEEMLPRTPHSPLDLRDAEPVRRTEDKQPSTHTAPTSPYRPETQTPTRHVSNDALSRADALLAAAATPHKETSNNSKVNLILAIGTVIILAIGSYIALTILKPPTTQQTNSPSPSSTTSTSTTTQNQSIKRDSQRKKDLNDIAVGLATYQKNTGSYPVGNDISALQPLTTSNPPYIEKIKYDPLSDPASNLIIQYSYSSDGKSYTLSATLENKNDPDAKNGLYVLKN